MQRLHAELLIAISHHLSGLEGVSPREGKKKFGSEL